MKLYYLNPIQNPRKLYNSGKTATAWFKTQRITNPTHNAMHEWKERRFWFFYTWLVIVIVVGYTIGFLLLGEQGTYELFCGPISTQQTY